MIIFLTFYLLHTLHNKTQNEKERRGGRGSRKSYTRSCPSRVWDVKKRKKELEEKRDVRYGEF